MARTSPADRDADIVARFEAGEPVADIARRHGVTRQRIQQIVTRAGASLPGDVWTANAEHARQARAELRQRFLDLVAKRPPMTLPEAARRLRVSQPTLAQALRMSDRRVLLATGTRGGPPRYSDEELLDALRKVAKQLRTERLTMQAYDEARAGRAGLPSGARVMQRFKTWSEACRQAGLQTREWRTGRERQWSREEMLQAVVDYLQDPGNAGTSWEYEVWRTGRGLPGFPTLRNVFGSWSAVKKEALERMAAAGRKRSK